MTKSTMGTKLPRKLEQKMQIVGEQIRLARLRRNLSIAQVAERATCSPLTVSRIEKGVPTVAIGIYLRVLYALQMDDDILLLAKEDTMERPCRIWALRNEKGLPRKHKKKLYVSADFDWLKEPKLIGELSYESYCSSDSYGFFQMFFSYFFRQMGTYFDKTLRTDFGKGRKESGTSTFFILSSYGDWWLLYW